MSHVQDTVMATLGSAAIVLAAAYAVYHPAPPVEKVIHIEYRCPPLYETGRETILTADDARFSYYYLTTLDASTDRTEGD